MRPLYALAVALLLAIPASAGGFLNIDGKSIDEYTGTLTLRGWMSEQNAAVQDSSNSLHGSSIDFVKDGTLDGHVYMPEMDLELRFQELGFHFTAWTVSDSDKGRFKTDETFDRHTYLGGDAIYERFRVGQAALHFEWIPLDLGSSKTIGFEFGIIAGVRATRMEVQLNDKVNHSNHSRQSIAALPDLGITINVGFLNIFEFEAQVSGFWLDVHNFDYQSINAGAELRIFFDEHFFVGLGCRLSSGSIRRGDPKRDGTLIEYTYFGPSVAIGLRF